MKRTTTRATSYATLTCLGVILLITVLEPVVLAYHETKSINNNNDLDAFTTSKPTALIKIHQNKKRDLGLFAIGVIIFKAVLLGPLFGFLIKALLVKGIFWALLAYGLQLFVPLILSGLGPATGLVGIARQVRPDYNQMFASHFASLLQTLPGSMGSMGGISGQYRQLIAPVIESIKAIPEGHCRYRAVCETASHLIRNSRSISNSLQRISSTVYMSFGNDYSKAWLDGVVQSDCATQYAQCTTSPFSMVAARLAQSIGTSQLGLGPNLGLQGHWGSSLSTPASIEVATQAAVQAGA